MTNPITTTDDIIDSRDVIERIAELKTEFMAATGDDDFDDEFMTSDDFRAGLGDDEGDELAALVKLDREGREMFSEWEYGVVLVRSDHFTDYARELAEDIGAYDKNAGWPLTHIDWDEAANALYVDYTEIDFDIYTYYGRV